MAGLSKPMQDALVAVNGLLTTRRGIALLPAWVKGNTAKALEDRKLIEFRLIDGSPMWRLTPDGHMEAERIMGERDAAFAASPEGQAVAAQVAEARAALMRRPVLVRVSDADVVTLSDAVAAETPKPTADDVAAMTSDPVSWVRGLVTVDEKGFPHLETSPITSAKECDECGRSLDACQCVIDDLDRYLSDLVTDLKAQRREVTDSVWRALQDDATLSDPDLVESLAQMRRGETIPIATIKSWLRLAHPGMATVGRLRKVKRSSAGHRAKWRKGR